MVLVGIPFFDILFYVSIPFMVWKELINFAQIYYSALKLVDLDLQKKKN